MILFQLPNELIGYIIHLTELENEKILPFKKIIKEAELVRLYNFNGQLKNGNPNGYGTMITRTNYNNEYTNNYNNSINDYQTIWIYVPLYIALYKHPLAVYFFK